VLLLSLLFTFNQSRLEQVESLVLQALDIVFTLAPFTEFLLFHELAAQVEAGFVRSGRQSVFEGPLFPHLLNELHLSHGGGQTFAEFKILNRKHFRNVVRFQNGLRRVRVGLGLTITVHCLNFSILSSRLFLGDFSRVDTFFRDLHDNFWRHGLQHGDNRALEVLVSVGSLDESLSVGGDMSVT